MRLAMLLAAVLFPLACGSDGPTGGDRTPPPLGTYAVRARFEIPNPVGPPLQGDETISLSLSFAALDSVAGTASGPNVMPGPFGLGFWNSDAYLIYVTMDYSPTAQIRATFQAATCSGAMRYPDGRRYTFTSCTVAGPT